MFSTLESSWDQSARRGWSAAASFTLQAMALSLLLAIPMFWVQGPPRLQWLQPLTAPMAPPAPAPPMPHQQDAPSSNLSGTHVLEPQFIPAHIAQITNETAMAPPDLPAGVWGSTGINSPGILSSIGIGAPTVTLRPAAPNHPLKISHWAEGNLIYRVQPLYPTLARQARIQGAVQLRALSVKWGRSSGSRWRAAIPCWRERRSTQSGNGGTGPIFSMTSRLRLRPKLR